MRLVCVCVFVCVCVCCVCCLNARVGVLLVIYSVMLYVLLVALVKERYVCVFEWLCACMSMCALACDLLCDVVRCAMSLFCVVFVWLRACLNTCVFCL